MAEIKGFVKLNIRIRQARAYIKTVSAAITAATAAGGVLTIVANIGNPDIVRLAAEITAGALAINPVLVYILANTTPEKVEEFENVLAGNVDVENLTPAAGDQAGGDGTAVEVDA